MTQKTIALTDILTPEEFVRAVNIATTTKIDRINRVLQERIFTDEKMQEINAITGQENSKAYFAYALEYVIQNTFSGGSSV